MTVPQHEDLAFVRAYSRFLGVTEQEAAILLEMEPLVAEEEEPRTAAAWDESEHPRHPAGDERGGEFAPKHGEAPDTSDIHTVGSERDPGWIGPELKPAVFYFDFMGSQVYLNGAERSDLAWDPTSAQALGANSTMDRVEQAEALRLNDLDLPAYKSAIGENAANELRGAELVIRSDLDGLTGVAEEGVFRTQFETAASRGAYSPEVRAAQERMFFGYPMDQVEGRPVYGYAVTPSWDEYDEMRLGSQYGPIRWRLKATDELRARTTVSGVDSLSRSIIPGPINNPGWRSTVPPGYNDPGMVRMKRDELTWGYGNGDVAEAQFHGGVTLDDVESVQIELDEAFVRRHPDLNDAVERLRNRGIEVELVGWR